MGSIHAIIRLYMLLIPRIRLIFYSYFRTLNAILMLRRVAHGSRSDFVLFFVCLIFVLFFSFIIKLIEIQIFFSVGIVCVLDSKLIPSNLFKYFFSFDVIVVVVVQFIYYFVFGICCSLQFLFILTNIS